MWLKYAKFPCNGTCLYTDGPFMTQVPTYLHLEFDVYVAELSSCRTSCGENMRFQRAGSFSSWGERGFYQSNRRQQRDVEDREFALLVTAGLSHERFSEPCLLSAPCKQVWGEKRPCNGQETLHFLRRKYPKWKNSFIHLIWSFLRAKKQNVFFLSATHGRRKKTRRFSSTRKQNKNFSVSAAQRFTGHRRIIKFHLSFLYVSVEKRRLTYLCVSSTEHLFNQIKDEGEQGDESEIPV